jgi:hypothetical protein
MNPALLINPVLISAPPILVLLLILLVPSVLAQPRIKSAAEIAAEADEQEARITANARVKEAQARANAKVRGARISGLADNANVIMQRAGMANSAPGEEANEAPELPLERTFDGNESGILPSPSAQVSRAMWNSMSLRERVTKSALITPQEVAEVLGISPAHARKLTADVRASEDDQRAVPGRKGIAYQALIDTLYERRTTESFAQAQKLEKALGLRKRTRQLHVVAAPDDVASDEESVV